MKNCKSVYNADKENNIFAVKLRGLFEETKRTQQELIDFIQAKTGKAPTRQAVSAWTHGNSPDIKTVPIIAEFFSVSTDYLLTETKIRPLDVKLTAVCEYTGLSPKSIKNLRAIRAHQLNADLLLEKDEFEDIVKHLCEIERLEIAKKYYDMVINPIANGDEFYDNLILNNVRLCKFSCDNFIKAYPEHKQECEKCDRRKELDKDYIFGLIRKALNKTLSEFGATFVYCPDGLSEDYENKSDLEEFKLTKAAAAIIKSTKDSSDSSAYSLEKNKSVREFLIKELRESQDFLEKNEHEYNDIKNGKYKDPDRFCELIEREKAEITAIQTFLEKYDENFNPKKGSDENG